MSCPSSHPLRPQTDTSDKQNLKLYGILPASKSYKQVLIFLASAVQEDTTEGVGVDVEQASP